MYVKIRDKICLFDAKIRVNLYLLYTYKYIFF